jgi:hypothetical protein
MKLEKKVRIPHYGPDLILKLIVADDIAQFCKDKVEQDLDLQSIGGGALLEWPMCVIMLRDDYVDFTTIGHELEHVVSKILRKVGMVECDESEEAYAYLSGWVLNWVMKTLQDWKLVKVVFRRKKVKKKRKHKSGVPAKASQAL